MRSYKTSTIVRSYATIWWPWPPPSLPRLAGMAAGLAPNAVRCLLHRHDVRTYVCLRTKEKDAPLMQWSQCCRFQSRRSPRFPRSVWMRNVIRNTASQRTNEMNGHEPKTKGVCVLAACSNCSLVGSFQGSKVQSLYGVGRSCCSWRLLPDERAKLLSVFQKVS